MPRQAGQQQQQHEPSPLGTPIGHAGISPRIGFITPPPPGKNGSCITRDPKFGRAPGVYPVYVTGTYVDDPANSLAAGEAINLCYIPHGVQLVSFTIATAGITGTLQDTLPTPTVYCTSVSGNLATMALMSATDAQNLGTMYFETPRAVGPFGPAVVHWYRGMTLQLANCSGPPGTPLIYVIEWAPVWDGGV